MKCKRGDIKLGEYVVITVTNEKLNHEINYCGKLIEIDTARGANQYREGVELTIKNSVLSGGAWKRKSFTFDRENFGNIHIRLMEFWEMPLRTKVSWFFRNVVFPIKYPATYKPATQLIFK